MSSQTRVAQKRYGRLPVGLSETNEKKGQNNGGKEEVKERHFVVGFDRGRGRTSGFYMRKP